MDEGRAGDERVEKNGYLELPKYEYLSNIIRYLLSLWRLPRSYPILHT